MAASFRPAGAAPPPGTPEPKAAAPAAERPDEAAARLLAEGRTLFGEGKSEAALVKLRAAWEIQQTYAIAANLGTAELDLGRMRDAAEHLDFALRAMPASVEKEKREALAAYLQKARSATGTLRVTIEPDGARMLVDGKPAGKAPLASELYVEPGEHAIAVEHEGYTARTERVKLTAGESRALTLRLVRTPSAPPPDRSEPPPIAAPAATSPSSRTPLMGLWIVVGAAGLGTGVYVAASAADQRPHMTDTTTMDAMIGLGAGMIALGLAAGIGGVLYERAEEPAVSRVWVAPVVGANRVGGSVGGTF